MLNKILVFASLMMLAIGGSTPVFAADGLTVSKDAPAGVEAAWTDERMRQATPMPFYDEEQDPDAFPSYLYDGEEYLGPPGSVSGGESGDSKRFSDEVDFGTPNRLDAYAGYRHVWNKKQYPWKTIGKLFFTGAAGGNFSCSASVIGRNDAIVTAAHCCYDNSKVDDWMSNWVFVPGYHNGSQPFGQFGWTGVTVLGAWVTSGGRHNDVCVITGSKGLSAAVGWLGRSWNKPQTVHVHTIGYPGNKGGGLTQQFCASENYKNCGSNLVNATGCNKTFGDSGGPWIRVYKPKQSGAKNYVNSVTSGWDGCTGTFGQSYNGARFTSNNIVTLCVARVCD